MTRRLSARRVAIDALVDVDGGARANEVVAARLAGSGLDGRDRAFVTELVYGTVRMRRACDWLVNRHVRVGQAPPRSGPSARGAARAASSAHGAARAASSAHGAARAASSAHGAARAASSAHGAARALDPPVRAGLRVGAYQLAFLGTPAHAAVAATVAEIDGSGRGLVNAVLRRVAEGLAAGPLRWPDLATELSYPDWIVDLFFADLGATDGRAALVQMDQPASATVRADGYIQDRASQLVAAHVGARAGERVLDMCAAPGGKATALASAGAMVVAVDIDAGRAARVGANAARLGLAGISVVVADGEHPPLAPASFDRVLVDAPCSGLGVLRRRPDARWRVRPDDLPRLAALQRRLLGSAADLLRPGGVLVYSVCTISRAETAGIDRWLAATRPDLVALPPPEASWRPAGRGALLFPHTEGTDGMFVLTLRSTGPRR